MNHLIPSPKMVIKPLSAISEGKEISDRFGRFSLGAAEKFLNIEARMNPIPHC